MSKWISVKEQPVPEDVEVLVCGKARYDIGRFISVCSTWSRIRPNGEVVRYVMIPCVTGYDTDTDFEPEDITHWMNLPDLPGE